MAATARVEKLTPESVAVEKKRQDHQKAVAELQRRRGNAEQRFALMEEGKMAAPSTPEIMSSAFEIRKSGVSNGLIMLLGFTIGAAAVLSLPWQLIAIAGSLLCILVLIVFYRALTKSPPDEGALVGVKNPSQAFFLEVLGATVVFQPVVFFPWNQLASHGPPPSVVELWFIALFFGWFFWPVLLFALYRLPEPVHRWRVWGAWIALSVGSAFIHVGIAYGAPPLAILDVNYLNDIM